MQMVMQLGARLFRLSYAEIWNMCTLNAAVSLGRGHDRGSLEPGKRADIVIWKVPEHGLVINRFGVNLVDTVLVEGEVVVTDGRAVSPFHARFANTKSIAQASKPESIGS
jgi:imidazolonepropionase